MKKTKRYTKNPSFKETLYFFLVWQSLVLVTLLADFFFVKTYQNNVSNFLYGLLKIEVVVGLLFFCGYFAITRLLFEGLRGIFHKKLWFVIPSETTPYDELRTGYRAVIDGLIYVIISILFIATIFLGLIVFYQNHFKPV